MKTVNLINLLLVMEVLNLGLHAAGPGESEKSPSGLAVYNPDSALNGENGHATPPLPPQVNFAPPSYQESLKGNDTLIPLRASSSGLSQPVGVQVTSVPDKKASKGDACSAPAPDQLSEQERSFQAVSGQLSHFMQMMAQHKGGLFQSPILEGSRLSEPPNCELNLRWGHNFRKGFSWPEMQIRIAEGNISMAAQFKTDAPIDLRTHVWVPVLKNEGTSGGWSLKDPQAWLWAYNDAELYAKPLQECRVSQNFDSTEVVLATVRKPGQGGMQAITLTSPLDESEQAEGYLEEIRTRMADQANSGRDRAYEYTHQGTSYQLQTKPDGSGQIHYPKPEENSSIVGQFLETASYQRPDGTRYDKVTPLSVPLRIMGEAYQHPARLGTVDEPGYSRRILTFQGPNGQVLPPQLYPNLYKHHYLPPANEEQRNCFDYHQKHYWRQYEVYIRTESGNWLKVSAELQRSVRPIPYTLVNVERRLKLTDTSVAPGGLMSMLLERKLRYQRGQGGEAGGDGRFEDYQEQEYVFPRITHTGRFEHINPTGIWGRNSYSQEWVDLSYQDGSVEGRENALYTTRYPHQETVLDWQVNHEEAYSIKVCRIYFVVHIRTEEMEHETEYDVVSEYAVPERFPHRLQSAEMQDWQWEIDTEAKALYAVGYCNLTYLPADGNELTREEEVRVLAALVELAWEDNLQEGYSTQTVEATFRPHPQADVIKRNYQANCPHTYEPAGWEHRNAQRHSVPKMKVYTERPLLASPQTPVRRYLLEEPTIIDRPGEAFEPVKYTKKSATVEVIGQTLRPEMDLSSVQLRFMDTFCRVDTIKYGVSRDTAASLSLASVQHEEPVIDQADPEQPDRLTHGHSIEERKYRYKTKNGQEGDLTQTLKVRLDHQRIELEPGRKWKWQFTDGMGQVHEVIVVEKPQEAVEVGEVENADEGGRLGAGDPQPTAQKLAAADQPKLDSSLNFRPEIRLGEAGGQARHKNRRAHRRELSPLESGELNSTSLPETASLNTPDRLEAHAASLRPQLLDPTELQIPSRGRTTGQQDYTACALRRLAQGLAGSKPESISYMSVAPTAPGGVEGYWKVLRPGAPEPAVLPQATRVITAVVHLPIPKSSSRVVEV